MACWIKFGLGLVLVKSLTNYFDEKMRVIVMLTLSGLMALEVVITTIFGTTVMKKLTTWLLQFQGFNLFHVGLFKHCSGPIWVKLLQCLHILWCLQRDKLYGYTIWSTTSISWKLFFIIMWVYKTTCIDKMHFHFTYVSSLVIVQQGW